MSRGCFHRLLNLSFEEFIERNESFQMTDVREQHRLYHFHNVLMYIDKIFTRKLKVGLFQKSDLSSRAQT